MNRLRIAVVSLGLFAALLGGCGKKEEPTRPSIPAAVSSPAATQGSDSFLAETATVQRETPRAIADSVTGTAARVLQEHAGGAGAPIVVLEEDHSSITGQAEIALVLAGLHERHGLTHIVLEGLTRPNLDADAAKIRAAVGDGLHRHAVAQLKEGEISAAEFAAIAFADVHVLQGESAANYAVDINREEQRKGYLTSYLMLAAIAEAQGAGEEFETVRREFAELVQSSAGGGDAKLAELTAKFIELDPWAKQKLVSLQSPKDSIEQEIALGKDIQARAMSLGIPVPAELSAIQAKFGTFLAARSAASDEMVQAARRIAKRGSARVVALIVGAGHSERVFQLLKSADWPSVVLSPVSLKSETAIRLSADQYERKLKGLPVAAEVVLGLARKKPEPVLAREWFQAKAELYSLADEVARGGGTGGGEPPTTTGAGGGLAEPDKNRRQFVKVVPNEIERSKEDGRDVAIFPVIVAGIGGQGERKLWLKVALTKDESPPKGSSKGVEDQLREAVTDLRAQGEEQSAKPREKAAAESQAPLGTRKGVIRITSDTVMAVADSKAEVAAMKFKTL